MKYRKKVQHISVQINLLVVEEYMCHLTYSKGHNTYYNAILLQVLKTTQGNHWKHLSSTQLSKNINMSTPDFKFQQLNTTCKILDYVSWNYCTMYNISIPFCKSFLEKDCVISAQYPLPDYSEDLLRLVRDFDARIVVFLCPIKDLASVRKFIQFFVKFWQYTIRFQSWRVAGWLILFKVPLKIISLLGRHYYFPIK